MSKSVGDILKDKLTGVKVEKIPEPKPPKTKSSGNSIMTMDYYEKPRIYLTDKDFSGVKDLTGGKDVYLAVKAKVVSYSSHNNIDNKGSPNEKTSVTLEILEIANITDLKDVKKK